jgi:hypothetical protein
VAPGAHAYDVGAAAGVVRADIAGAGVVAAVGVSTSAAHTKLQAPDVAAAVKCRSGKPG